MTTAFSLAEVRWLTDLDAPVVRIDHLTDLPHQEIPMSPTMGSGWLEMLHLALGMHLSRGTHHFTKAMTGQLLPFARITAELPEDTWTVQSARSGRVRLYERRVGSELTFGGEVVLFQHSDRLDYEPHLDGSTMVQVTVLSIGDTLLARLLGEPLACSLVAGLGVVEVPSARVLAIPDAITASLYAALSTEQSGALRKLYAQSKVLEYLGRLTEFMAGEHRASSALPLGRRRRVEQLRAELERADAQIPSLDELARRYHTSARTLNDDFKQVVGQSIFAFVTRRRLDQAHVLIQETAIPLKQLSARLGYTHVNHFSAAFRRLFGYPPGSLRRGRKAEPDGSGFGGLGSGSD
jgi:AraC-like DNA-binding protein